MNAPQQIMVTNKLLALLPPDDYRRLSVDLTYIDLPRGKMLAEAGKPITTIYFMTSGVGSIIATSPEGHQAEAGIFGLDGFAPSTAVTGVMTGSHDVVTQIGGDAYSMPYSIFQKWMERNKGFARIIIRANEILSFQVAQTALSNAVHDVNERLARWLLMCHDRIAGNEIALTHDFLSVMLAVRRPSVTTSLHVLEGNGFIWTERGVITIRNRLGLEEFAQDAYGKPEQEYRRLMKDLF